MRYLALIGLLLVATPSFALDCAPFQSWTCANQGYFDLLAGQPGEIVCGADYTGWTIHVIEVTTTVPGWIRFSGISAHSSNVVVDTAILLMDDCATSTCLDGVTSSGQADLDVCLDVGTHTFIVASNTQDPTAYMNTGIFCLTCEEAGTYGFACDICNAVQVESKPWGAVKTLYR